MKAIIFDFNRTIYDPDSRRVIFGARKILGLAKSLGFQLFLLSQRENGREEILNRKDLCPFFEKIFFVKEKNQQVFEGLIEDYLLDRSKVLVVGDRLSAEIKLGGLVGCKTIWLKRGKFSREKPRGVRPNYVITDIRELSNFLEL